MNVNGNVNVLLCRWSRAMRWNVDFFIFFFCLCLKLCKPQAPFIKLYTRKLFINHSKKRLHNKWAICENSLHSEKFVPFGKKKKSPTFGSRAHVRSCVEKFNRGKCFFVNDDSVQFVPFPSHLNPKQSKCINDDKSDWLFVQDKNNGTLCAARAELHHRMI